MSISGNETAKPAGMRLIPSRKPLLISASNQYKRDPSPSNWRLKFSVFSENPYSTVKRL
jgi:hypothetical protein